MSGLEFGLCRQNRSASKSRTHLQTPFSNRRAGRSHSEISFMCDPFSLSPFGQSLPTCPAAAGCSQGGWSGRCVHGWSKGCSMVMPVSTAVSSDASGQNGPTRRGWGRYPWARHGGSLPQLGHPLGQRVVRIFLPGGVADLVEPGQNAAPVASSPQLRAVRSNAWSGVPRRSM